MARALGPALGLGLALVAATAAALSLGGCASGSSARLGETAELYRGVEQVPAPALELVGPITAPLAPAADAAHDPSRSFVFGGVSGPTVFLVVDERGVVAFRRAILFSPDAAGLVVSGDYMIEASVDEYAELRQLLDEGRWISDLRAKPEDLKPKASGKKRSRRS
jgi:hypothetical protein